MNCMRCGRPVFKPALLLGGRPIGPKCAKRAGLMAPKWEPARRLTKPSPQPLNPAQMVLFNEYAPSF